MSAELIKSLANQMGVSESDVLCFARSIVNSIEKDRSSDFFIEACEDMQCDMIEAYASHAVRKINEFHTSYITNSGVRDLLNDMVYAQVKYGDSSNQ